MDTQNNTVAVVEHAGNIDDSTKQQLIQKINDRFSDVGEVVFREDSDLIAGIRISYQDYIYEDSVKAKLQELEYASS